MRERLWLLFGLLLGVAFAVQVAMPVDLSESPETSFETAPRGHAALFELLTRYESVRGRWLSGLSMPAVEDTVWWIAAPGVCDTRVELDVDERAEPTGRDVLFRWTVEPWIEAGGTAVVWLSHPPVDSQDESESEQGGAEIETREVAYRRPSVESSRPPKDGRRSDGSPDSVSDGEGDPNSGDKGSEVAEREDAESTREQWHDTIEDTRRQLRDGEPRRCLGIVGYPLPPRYLAGLEGGELPADADYAATAFSVGRWVESRKDFDYSEARTLPGATLGFFGRDSERLAGWQPLWIEADDFAPLALERRVGKGRLIVVADARVLTNARLGQIDSAPFVFDWVEEWGAPWIDEHRHGVVPESGAFRYIASSPAAAACVGLIALGALFVWRGHALPKRRVEEADPEAPTLAAFVDSLANLYARTGDHARAFERYRELSLERIRRALGLPPGTPPETVLATLRVRAENRPSLRERGVRDLLMKNLRIESAAELERAAGRLDALVQVLRDENGPADAARRMKT
jgi:hypothetical protein